jgi:hypothetical protein
MKQLIIKLVLPLAIIAFALVTKWWYVLPDDAPDSMLLGFPLAFVGDGWFTSMSLQIFVVEFIIDYLCYFLLCFSIVFIVNKYIIKIKITKILVSTIWSLAILLVCAWLMIFCVTEKQFKVTRDWKMQVLDGGFTFTITNKSRPELSNYELKKH